MRETSSQARPMPYFFTRAFHICAVSGKVERQACGAGVDDDHADVPTYASGCTDQVSLFWILCHNRCQRGIGNVDQCVEHAGYDVDDSREDHAECRRSFDCKRCKKRLLSLYLLSVLFYVARLFVINLSHSSCSFQGTFCPIEFLRFRLDF